MFKPAERCPFLRLTVWIGGINLNNISGAIGFVRMQLDVESIINFRPAVSSVFGGDAVSFLFV